MALKTSNRGRYNFDLMLKTVRHIIAFILLIIGIGLLVWASWPVREQTMLQTILPEAMRVPKDGEPAQAVLEIRQVELEWPESLRIGDSGEIRLAFVPAGVGTPADSSGIKFGDVYDQYNLMAEGRFEVTGVKVEPANPVRESFLAGQKILYAWKITADEAGIYPGTVWLYLRFLPLNESSPSQSPIFVSRVELKITSLWGISGPIARLLGSGAMGLSVIASFDVMIVWITERISRRTRSMQRKIK
jgi:hypothetical protein